MKRSVWIWIATVGIFAAIMVYQYLQLDNSSDLKGGFERVSYVRNENNQGGIYQYYAYTVKDSADAEYLKMVEMLPLSGKTGLTTVYFFDKKGLYPSELKLSSPHFDPIFVPIKVFERDKVGVREVEI
jgi:hypothetical protein